VNSAAAAALPVTTSFDETATYLLEGVANQLTSARVLVPQLPPISRAREAASRRLPPVIGVDEDHPAPAASAPVELPVRLADCGDLGSMAVLVDAWTAAGERQDEATWQGLERCA